MADAIASAVTLIAAAGGGGIVTVAGQTFLGWLNSRNNAQALHVKAEETERAQDIDFNKHRDQLMIEMVETIRAELVRTQAEIAGYQNLTSRLNHFEEALDYIQLLITEHDPEIRAKIEARAQIFVTRMRRLAEAQGAMVNEEQRQLSASRLGLAKEGPEHG